MNDRIQELASCNERIQSFFETGPVQRAAIEQFAELIVQECLAQIDKVRDSCDGDEAEQELGAAWAGLAVARHFGVE